jgi:hypothetical protein
MMAIIVAIVKLILFSFLVAIIFWILFAIIVVPIAMIMMWVAEKIIDRL